MNFAHRRKKNIIAIVCDCGKTITGTGSTRWKYCPYCGALIIRAQHQRLHEVYSGGFDEEILNRYRCFHPFSAERCESKAEGVDTDNSAALQCCERDVEFTRTAGTETAAKAGRESS
jgi:predicted RNA-binding Zn-ribbon protein involved in translation (DUF1610 family)